jgi:hypothetical protein
MSHGHNLYAILFIQKMNVEWDIGSIELVKNGLLGEIDALRSESSNVIVEEVLYRFIKLTFICIRYHPS